MATACQWLAVRAGEAWLAEDLGLLMPLAFPDTGALLGIFARYAMSRDQKLPAIQLPAYWIDARFWWT
jgi:hypothetical protein